MIYLLTDSYDHISRISYVFQTIFHILGIEFEFEISNGEVSVLSGQDVALCYVKDPDTFLNTLPENCNAILIKNSGRLFGAHYLESKSMPSQVRKQIVDDTNLISIYNDFTLLYVKRLQGETGEKIVTNIDIVSDIFFMLTRYEEIVNSGAVFDDPHVRFPAKQSTAYRYKFLDRPVVNEHIKLLWSWIDSLGLGYKKKMWWQGHDFAVCISHDIDIVRKCRDPVHLLWCVIRCMYQQRSLRKGVKLLLKSLASIFDNTKDPYWTFDYMLDKLSELNMKSTFYFMVGGSSKYDNKYAIEKQIIALIRQIHEKSFEVGYHASYNSFDNYNQMKQEVELLESILSETSFGCRQHYLRFQVPFTWRIQEACNLMYDTTLGFADCEGFRAGMCFPYKPYDLLDDRVINIWEIPLIVMDSTLQNYRQMTPDGGLASIKKLVDKAKSVEGVFTTLWHNTSFADECEEWRKTIESMCLYCNKLSGYVTTPKELLRELNHTYSALARVNR